MHIYYKYRNANFVNFIIISTNILDKKIGRKSKHIPAIQLIKKIPKAIYILQNIDISKTSE